MECFREIAGLCETGSLMRLLRRVPLPTSFVKGDAVPLSIIIFGATGDLAKKKLFPAVYQLLYGAPDAPLLPSNVTRVIGVGRSEVTLDAFIQKQCINVKGEHRDAYLKVISYFKGSYDQPEDFARLDAFLCELEGSVGGNRLFFLSVPPTVFAQVCQNVSLKARAPGDRFTRLIIEKPFGRDSQSFAELDAATSSLFREDQLYRIDHYLGKEVVLNMVSLRFGNQFIEPLWNAKGIESVQIVFKEDLGTGGRGGYFDGFGIIRDIMQNHLLQVFVWFAMEPPTSLDADAIALEKVRVLSAVKALEMKDCFLGQFSENSWNVSGQVHAEPGYLDDPTVPPGSRCPTYAGVVMHVDNDRWRGVPFLFRAGKGLDERLAEVRVTFKKQSYNGLVTGPSNELVMRIQPDEAIYMKVLNKVPGWDKGNAGSVVLDMSYKDSFSNSYVADAYERMFLNAARGEQSLFVGDKELVEAWRIFTPLLHEIDATRPQPVLYPFGSRVPPGMDAFAKRYGITMSANFEEFLGRVGKEPAVLRKRFAELDKDKDGKLNAKEMMDFAQMFYDGRHPPESMVARIISRIDTDGDGMIAFDELLENISHLQSWCVCPTKLDHSSG